MNLRSFLRPIGLIFAAIFVFEAWAWDNIVLLGRRLVALMPWDAFKARLSTLVARLPAPVVLLIFIIPVIVIEPFKLAAFYFIGHGRVFLGVMTFIAAKFVGVGLVAFLFDLCRDKLLTIGWVRWVYDRAMLVHAWAHRLVTPYKLQLAELAASTRERLWRAFGS